MEREYKIRISLDLQMFAKEGPEERKLKMQLQKNGRMSVMKVM